MLNPKTGKRWKVYCGHPTVGSVIDTLPFMLREIEKRYGDEVELVFPEHVAHRHFHDYARNAIVDDFLATDCDILWMVDSDVCPPRHIMDLVTLHGDKWQASGACYPIFMKTPDSAHRQVIFTVYKGQSGQGMHASSVPYSGTDWVDGLATGCLFLKRELLESMEAPYFEFKFDAKTRHMTEGEDLGFALKLKARGIQFFTDYSMVCKHEKKVCLLELNNYAMEYAKRSIEAYDARVRAAVTAHQKSKSKIQLLG